MPSCVETFITAINHDIKSSKTKKLPRDNLAKSEREALFNLQERNDIITTKANKGDTVVILGIKDYIGKASRQLNDTNNHEQLDFDRAISIPRNELLNKIKTSKTERLSLTVTYNKTLPDVKTVIEKNWHILQIEPKLKEIFTEPQTLAFKRNITLKDIIGGNNVLDNKKILNLKKFNKGKCQP